VAAALVSALSDKPLQNNSVWFGEVSLAGEVRPVAHSGIRRREAAKLGFSKAIGPRSAGDGDGSNMYDGVTMLPNLIDRILGEA
jgi:DNA repair protein RadA/Sms